MICCKWTNSKCVFFSITCNESVFFFFSFFYFKKALLHNQMIISHALCILIHLILQRYENNYSDKAWCWKQSSMCTLGMSGSQDWIFNVHIKSKSCYDGRAPRSLSLFKGKKSTNVNQSFLAMLLKIGEEGSKAPHLALPHLSVRTLHFHPPLRPKSLPRASLSLGKQTLPG